MVGESPSLVVECSHAGTKKRRACPGNGEIDHDFTLVRRDAWDSCKHRLMTYLGLRTQVLRRSLTAHIIAGDPSLHISRTRSHLDRLYPTTSGMDPDHWDA